MDGAPLTVFNILTDASLPARVLRINRSIIERCTVVAPPAILTPKGEPLLGPCLCWQGPSSGAKTASRASRGHSYPRMALDGQTVAVHRVLWVNTFGYLPGKKQLDHLCKVRSCVSPFHCEKVTHRENQKRRDRSNKEKTDVQVPARS